MGKGKPFIKWVGGKSRLIGQLEALLPAGFAWMDDVTYVEPFVGGGAMLFHMLREYPCVKSAVINDANPDLTACYEAVRDSPAELVESLRDIQAEYLAIPTEESRKDFYLGKRDLFNSKSSGKIGNAALLIFLNRTCFNGLYRVNRAGKFNVPFGRYKSPNICDYETIYADSELLQKVDIMTGDFKHTLSMAPGNAFFYLDPPYRPVSETSSFTGYAKEGFDDVDQARLRSFCDRVDEKGALFMLSNSDGSQMADDDQFLETLYGSYAIERIWAPRSVSGAPGKRGKVTEIVVRNYGLE